jgi:AhpD family alkylhydroperoxidase
MKSKTYRKRIFTPQSFHVAMDEVCMNMADLKDAMKVKRVGGAFMERIMMAVTQVNGCRYCNYGHAKAALAAGVTPEEIEALRQADFSLTPEEQLTALLYAQHYAETQGSTDPEADDRLNREYGEEAAGDIRAFIRFMTFGNLAGNTIDATLSRFTGCSAPGSSVWWELRIILEMMTILPVRLLRHWFFPMRPSVETGNYMTVSEQVDGNQ